MGHAVNEIKFGYNGPETSVVAFGTPGYDPVGVSLSGTVTSQSIDARGSTGIARSGLLIRASSNTSTVGSIFDPRSLSIGDSITWNRGAHTVKAGAEYRNIESQFQFLGSTEITYNSVNDFIDNRPNAVAVALDSPVFTPQQYYLIGFVQDSWRAMDRLTLELGLRYDFYSVVKEKNQLARPFFVEDNAFSSDPDDFYDADKNNFAPRVSAAYEINDKTAVRAGFGFFYGPGQFEDRIQPIENYIERRRVGLADVPNNGLSYPVSDVRPRVHALGPRLHAPSPGRVQRSVRRQRVARAPGRDQPVGRLHGKPGQGHVPARRGEHARLPDPGSAGLESRPGGLQDIGLRRRPGDQRQPDQRMRPRQLRRAADRSARGGSGRALPAGSSISIRRTRARPRDPTKRRRPRTRSTSRPSTGPTRRTSRIRSTGRSSI